MLLKHGRRQNLGGGKFAIGNIWPSVAVFKLAGIEYKTKTIHQPLGSRNDPQLKTIPTIQQQQKNPKTNPKLEFCQQPEWVRK